MRRISSGMNKESAFDQICIDYSESTPDQIKKMLNQGEI